MARYSSPPPRVAAFRRSSREIVDGDRLTRLAISRTPHPRARKIAISSRSANDKYRPDSGARLTGRIPRCHGTSACQPPGTHQPQCRRPHSAFPWRSPPRTAAALLAWPPEAAPANASPAAPPEQPPIPAAVPFAHLHTKVLRRPIEFALAAVVAVMHQAGDAVPGAKPR